MSPEAELLESGEACTNTSFIVVSDPSLSRKEQSQVDTRQENDGRGGKGLGSVQLHRPGREGPQRLSMHSTLAACPQSSRHSKTKAGFGEEPSG